MATSKGEPGIPAPVAAEVVHNLLLQKENPAVLKPGYPTDVQTDATATQLILQLLAGTPIPAEAALPDEPDTLPPGDEPELHDNGLRTDETL